MKLNEITGMPKATSISDLYASIKGGKFTKDGSDLIAKSDLHMHERALTSLVGCPKSVGRDFYCYDNMLTSLKGCPQVIPAAFYGYSNKLTSLIGGPKKVGTFFFCYDNKLTSLEGCPQEVGEFSCIDNKITSLHDIHKHLKKMNGTFFAAQNPIKSHVLGLLKIPGCKKVLMDDLRAQEILNKYLPLGDLLDCQEELIEAGREEFAQL